MKYFLSFLVLTLLICSCDNYGTKLKYNNNDLFYTDNVSKEQAQKLGSYLQEVGFFEDNGKHLSVQLDRNADTLLFRMVTLDSFVNSPKFNDIAKTICTELSSKVFDNKPVVVHLCDDHLRTERIVRL